MLSKFTLLLVAVCLAACQPSKSVSTETAPQKSQAQMKEDSSIAGPTRFELRDFQLDEEKQSYGGALYKGRGTLVTKDPAVVKGNYLVWLTVKQEHKNDDQARVEVLVHDGIGTVEIRTYLTKEELEKTKVKYFDWQVLGYMPMTPGTIMTDTTVAQVK